MFAWMHSHIFLTHVIIFVMLCITVAQDPPEGDFPGDP
jgi:hypothetical protein